MMVYLPMSRSAAVAVRGGSSAQSRTGPGRSEGWVGHAATPALMRSCGYDPSMAEEADYDALCYAAIRALTSTEGPLRLVLAVEVAEQDLGAGAFFGLSDSDPYGAVPVDRISWSAVTAVFADEAGSACAVAAARAALTSDTELAEALQHPTVQALLEDRDLLWFAPQELDEVPY